MNNIGDSASKPQSHGSHHMEQSLVRYWAQMLGWDPTDTWGCMMDSGSQGNLQALYMARNWQRFTQDKNDRVNISLETSHYSLDTAKY
jgi:glutamate/tyrosine decarboxylase-like PLP-dependent enzyme